MSTAVPREPLPGFKFGADPELFVLDSNDKPVCPTFIPGTKEEPFPVQFGAVQRDGMAAEFNIEPAENYQDFNRNINAVLNQMKKMLPPGHKLATHAPSITFDQAVWDAAPDDAKELGCSPDFNAWTGGLNSPPAPDIPTMRCAGGHLHIGWTEGAEMDDVQHIANCRDLVKQLDWFLGAWSVTADPDPFRRMLYGKAGACRYKPYGVEYRVLSNFWLRSPSMRVAVWNRMNDAIKGMASQYMPDKVRATVNDELISSINNSQLSRYIQKYNFPLMKTTIVDPLNF